ncbi:hypothetical protein ANCCAN_06153 [Ancylostoma caninum]|uniref:Uncharacterized protein n=1 Tax=Ancylostoma caninum TaxID=29170 RepID=A0A368GTV9_ANCCA|nr:hypothetical protein ANCCAN_06153 [Ancylostoma caninum]
MTPNSVCLQYADRLALEAVQRLNSMKQDVIAKLKEELERYKSSEAERKQKRDDAERKRLELKEKLAANLAQVKTLSSQVEASDVNRVSQAKTVHDVRTKLANLRTRISNIADKEKQLMDIMHPLKQPACVEQNLVSDVYVMKETIEKELSGRRDSFDMTAIVAEVEALESVRKERIKLSEELAAKTEMLAALDADNEALQLNVEELQRKLSLLEAEKEKVIHQSEANTTELEELTSRIADLEKEIEESDHELKELESRISTETQLQEEIELQLKSASEELEEKKEQCLQEEKILREMEEEFEKKRVESEMELENMLKEYEQRIEDVEAQQGSCRQAIEEAAAEVEKMEKAESFLNTYRENCNKIQEKHTNLATLEEEVDDLRKKCEEKREKLAEENARLLDLRQDVESKKREMDKDLEDAKGQIEVLHSDMLKVESEAIDLQNKGYEIEGEIHLVKHQLSTKSEELTVAKNQYFVMKEMQESEEIARQKKLSKDQRMKKQREERKRKQEKTRKAGEERESMRKVKAAADRKERLASRAVLKVKENQRNDRVERCIAEPKRMSRAQNPERVNKRNEDELDDMVSTIGSQPTVGAPVPAESGRIFNDPNKSASLQHSATIASTLADEFKRPITVDLDDTITREDDNDDLFGLPGEYAGTPHFNDEVRNEVAQDRSTYKSPGVDGNDIHFEPSELFTSTPLVIKKECSVRPTRVKSVNHCSQNSQLSQSSHVMPPFRMRSGENQSGPARGRPRGRKNKKR